MPGRPTRSSKHGAVISQTVFWGSYVAFIRPPTRASSYILRDCSGKIPCFVMTHSDTSIVFASLNDLAYLRLPKFSINEKYLAGFLYEPELAQRDCAVNEIAEVLAGECIEINNGGSTHFALWDPRAICRKTRLEDYDEASRQVAKVTQACIDSWASKYDRIVHQLSGGLDSSVVLGCLRNSPYCPDITCLHLETSGADGSEAQYARLVAETNGATLMIQPGYSSRARYDKRIFDLCKSPKPSVNSLAMTLDYDARNHIPNQFAAEAVWDGQGGDHLFFQSSSAFGAVDYAFNHGIFGPYLTHVRSSVKRSRQSIWGVLAKSVRLGVLRTSWRPEDEYNRSPVFTSPAVVPKDLRALCLATVVRGCRRDCAWQALADLHARWFASPSSTRSRAGICWRASPAFFSAVDRTLSYYPNIYPATRRRRSRSRTSCFRSLCSRADPSPRK